MDSALKELEDNGQVGNTLEAWVVAKCNDWRDIQESNYYAKWDEYYRIWRGIFDAKDKERSSERSTLISPATQQAVESSVSELEEATFGRGSFFDITDDMDDSERADIQYLKNKLATEFQKHNIRKDCGEVILNAAVFGTGIAELVVDDYVDYAPAEQEDDDGLRVIGRNENRRVCTKMRPVNPKHFRIPDTATSIDDALGVGIEEFVAPDYVWDLQERGVYMDTDTLLASSATDGDLEDDPSIENYNTDRVKLLRYYGKVPRHLLEEVEGFEATQNHSDTYYTEAVVVIANDGVLLKAIDNPYLMNDRPVIAFQWDIVPGRFWGRGVCEKGYNPQKALDAELRQRRDAMSMNVAPMIGIDATRLPMLGQKLQIQPGKNILTNGDPREILHPFRFGDLPQSSYQETDTLSRMVQMATGAVDSAGIAGQINGEATAAGISMSLGAIIKRHKRTLVNFQESFLIPFVRKAAYRYMQFDPENFPVRDYNFHVTTSLGIMAREYEISQMTQLLQTMPPESPGYNLILKSMIDNMNLSNREELIKQLEAAAQPNPQAQQAAMEAERRAEEVHQAQLQVLAAQAAESQARATKYKEEARLMPLSMQIDMVEATADVNNDAADDFAKAYEIAKFDFEKKKSIADLALREKSIDNQARAQRENANGSKQNGIQQRSDGNQ
jgi:hypothetical protein